MRPTTCGKAAFLLLTALGCGQVKTESNELRFKLHGTLVLSGGHQEGGCGAPTSENTGVYMMEPPRKYEAEYRAWTDAAGRTWLDGGKTGCVLEVESMELLKAKDTPCIIAEGSTMDMWGIYEQVYSYLEIDLDAGTFRASERSKVVDAADEARETCSLAEGWIEELP